MLKLLSTKQTAKFLGVNEKMVYTLVSDKGLPATKVTGKWLFPQHLVEQWIEMNTSNYPDPSGKLPEDSELLIITGSNDPLLEQTITLFNKLHSNYLAVFGSLGSMGGVKALMQNRCHMASSHLLEENQEEYNFGFLSKNPGKQPALINFSRREQGILVKKGNPKGIHCYADMAKPGVIIVNRPLGTGTRHLLDSELKKEGISRAKIKGYQNIVAKHMDVGLEILTGKADAGAGIRPIATMLGLDFIPIRWERFDLLITKENFFNQAVQLFKELLSDVAFGKLAQELGGYDLSQSGKMVFPQG